MWTNIKTLYAWNWNNIFEKKNSKYEILNHLYFGPNFVFLGDCFRMKVSFRHFLNLQLIRNGILYKRTNINNFIIHFLSVITVRNKFYCRGVIINCFITHFLELYSIEEQNLKHENNYQQLYRTFLIFVGVRNQA